MNFAPWSTAVNWLEKPCPLVSLFLIFSLLVVFGFFFYSVVFFF